MSDRSRQFTAGDLNAIHSASMSILERHGIVIKDEGILDFFRRRGFSVEGQKIRMTESQVRAALETAPSRFGIRARNPKNDIEVGGAAPALSGTGGPTLIIEADGRCREATLDDYRKFCQLIQSSRLPQILPHEMIHPMDVPVATAHLDMLQLDLSLCDRALTGDTLDLVTTRDSLKILEMVFGGPEKLKETTASINIINPLSPLAFAPDQAAALMLLAEHNQAVALTNMILLGSTAPVDLASALAIGNAELLAGVVLSQLVRPGAPVVYGSTSCPMEMKSGTTSLGKPETLLYIQATIELAHFYKLPARSGGSLTDAHLVDAQAGCESALILKTALDNGVDYVLHAFGMMSSYMAASLEKWLVDEEVAALVLAAREPGRFDPSTIDLDYILEMGAGGNYLNSPRTFKSFRNLYPGGFLNAKSHSAWTEQGAKSAVTQAREAVESRLAKYETPAMDQGLERELNDWIKFRKKEML